MSRYHVINAWKLEAWADDQPEPRCKAMWAWLAAATLDPLAVSHGMLVREGLQHRLHYAFVPGASCIVTFAIGEVPVRALIIVDVVDDHDG